MKTVYSEAEAIQAVSNGAVAVYEYVYGDNGDPMFVLPETVEELEGFEMLVNRLKDKKHFDVHQTRAELWDFIGVEPTFTRELCLHYRKGIWKIDPQRLIESEQRRGDEEDWRQVDEERKLYGPRGKRQYVVFVEYPGIGRVPMHCLESDLEEMG